MLRTYQHKLNDLVMDKSKNFVITVNRQFGTGGHDIASELAKALGVKLIDKQILQAVAQKFSLSEEKALELENKRPTWWEDFSRFYQSFVDLNHYNGIEREVTSRQLFYAQAAEIKRIAQEESCVVVGRCGFDIFKNHPNAVRIFLHSSFSHRLNRIMNKYQVDEEQARIMIEDNDYTRELYTKTFTSHDWYDGRNYNLVLDITAMTNAQVVNFLLRFIDEYPVYQ